MTLSKLSTYTDIDLNTFTTSTVSVNENKKEQVLPVSIVTNTQNAVKVKISEELVVTNTKAVCRRCGKVLKDINSITLGMGPTCYKQFMLERRKQINLLGRITSGKTQNNE